MHADADQRIVFLLFRGDAAMAQHLAEHGWYASFAGPVTRRTPTCGPGGPATRTCLVETDAPLADTRPVADCNASHGPHRPIHRGAVGVSEALRATNCVRTPGRLAPGGEFSVGQVGLLTPRSAEAVAFGPRPRA